MRRLRRYLLTGLAVVLPTALTAYVLWFLFIKLDGILGTYIRKKVGVSIPGIGFAAVLVIVLAAGAMASNLIGKRLIKTGQRVLEAIPLFNRIYVSIREISDALLGERSTVFRRVALVEFPRPGSYSICFITSENEGQIDRKLGKKTVSVFVPTVPNPTTGFLLIIPANEVIPLDMSVEDGLKMVISGGSVVPESLRAKRAEPAAGTNSKDTR